jgi:hypothetical protein
MKTLSSLALSLVVLWFTAPMLSAQSQAYQISASVKTLSKTKSDKQDLPRGSTRLVEEEKVLALQLRRTSPSVGESAEVRWVVLMEDMNGRTRPVVKGGQQIATQVGIPIDLESEAFSLLEREWNGSGNRKDGSVEQKVKGYGIVILDEKGAEIASKFSSGALESALRKALTEEAAPAVPEDKRPRRKLPVL